jgi:hypothetical protein
MIALGIFGSCAFCSLVMFGITMGGG